jgi:hypothetical protein
VIAEDFETVVYGHTSLGKLARRLVTLTLMTSGLMVAYAQKSQPLRGTLVVAVPVKEGLVVCSDKRLFNIEAGTFSDNSTKIRKVNNNALFVATNTIGFFDQRSGKMKFDAVDITAKYVADHDLRSGKQFWDGLKKEIRERLDAYFAKEKFSEWPESDKANNNLLFNLLFYLVDGNQPRGYTLEVFYEKARTPIIYFSGPTGEVIRSPKLGGKGKDLLNYISRNPGVALDPIIVRFGGTNFDIQKTSAPDAVTFAEKLFVLTGTALPEAKVSPTFDCALLDYQRGFQLLNNSVHRP